jgi:AcrR family transcriptional regulator
MARKAQFDRVALARAGLRVTRQDGWSAVTLQSVATELSVTPMALYRLVDDAAGLKRIVADRAALSIQATMTERGLIQDLHAWALGAYGHLTKLPGLTSYVLHEWTELPNWLSIIDAFLDEAGRENLTGATAVHTVNVVFSYVLARVQLRESITPRRKLGPVIASPAQFPRIDANRHEFQVAQSDVAFRFGLDALVTGFRA